MIAITRCLALVATILFAAQSVALQGALASETILTICTPDGTKDIVLDENGEPREIAKQHCFKCFIGSAGLPPEPTALALVLHPEIPAFVLTKGIKHVHLATGFAARAPPQI